MQVGAHLPLDLFSTPPNPVAQLTLTPLRAGLVAGMGNSVDVLVRLRAKSAPHQGVQRPPLALALVLDTSGSMSGEPIAQVKRCARRLVSMLQPTDHLSLVQFATDVHTLRSAKPVGDGVEVRAAIDQMDAAGRTNLHGGWLAGAQALEEVAEHRLRRVLVLSDGVANEGVTDAVQMEAECARWAYKGITTTTVGLGAEFNEDLMVAMARRGGGSSYYGRCADDLMRPFAQEMDLLGSLCLSDLGMALQVPDDVVVEVLGDLWQVNGRNALQDLAWGAESWAMLRLHVPAHRVDQRDDADPLLHIAVTGRSLTPAAMRCGFDASLALPRLSRDAWCAMPSDALTQARLTEMAASRAMLAIRVAASQGDWPKVEALLKSARIDFAGHAWVTDMLCSLLPTIRSQDAKHTSKELLYASSSLSGFTRSAHERLYMVDGELIETPAYLRRAARVGQAG
jgi:Ca-activated chloride channel family protein